MRTKRTVAMAMVFGVVLVSGCRVSSDKHGDGDDVKIATPFGGLQVKTNDAAVQAELGLPMYPGAVLMKKDKGKSDGAADVNLSFGSFQLKVKAASYRTTDSPDKVSAFYRKALEQYGDVIQCQDHKSVGELTQTTGGLTCDNDHDENRIKVDEDVSSKKEWKAGSKQHQHIVSVEPDGSGTKFGLVALDLPGRFSFGEGNRENKQ